MKNFTNRLADYSGSGYSPVADQPLPQQSIVGRRRLAKIEHVPVAAEFGPEAYQKFHHGALKAYFTENRTISERSVLLDIAAEVGIDRAEFDAKWESNEEAYFNQVVHEHNEAIGAGINAVPSLVVGERYLVPGAVDVSDYRNVIERFRAERDAVDNS